jgi:Amidohydrolase family
MKKLLVPALALVLLVSAAFSQAQDERFVVIVAGNKVGHLDATTATNKISIDFDVKNNGRGPTIKETLQLDANGLPATWAVSGSTTFGSKVAESFTRASGAARWVDSTGKGSVRLREPALYIGQSASPWAAGLYARVLLGQPNNTIRALPGGEVRLAKGNSFTVRGANGDVRVTRYSILGLDLDPEVVLLDEANRLFALPSPRAVVVREGYEGEESRLRELAAQWETERFAEIEKRVARRYGAPVRIRNVRVFDPKTLGLTDPVAVVVSGNKIAGIQPLDSPSTPGEVIVDGAGGTLVAGMTDMHAHLGQGGALLNVLAGVTTVRDMGNDNAVLDELIRKMEAGEIGGPRVVRSGFIEGKSPFNSNNGILVDTEEKAVDAVRWYAARGFWQIKIYNSINPKWVPAMIREARKLGLRVAGHVPAFTTPDAMLDAGYDEMTHINQFMLGWVITPDEDTRTLLRLTRLMRFATLPLNSEAVERTIGKMVDRKVAIDPTIGIHENLTLNRNGQIPPGAVDYYAHMPIAVQRNMLQAWADSSGPGEDAAYRGAFDKILATTRILRERGVFIVPGTDTGGSFTYHRELELMQKIGMTPAEVLKRATYDVAQYMGLPDRGSIEEGKLADFFLIAGDPTQDLKAIKKIQMVIRGGTVYLPSEAYPEFGIKPFVAAPVIVLPQTKTAP